MNISSSFATYILERKAVIQSNIHVSNNEGELFYTNASESINAKIKRYVKFKSMNLLNFLKAMQEFLNSEIGSAVDAYMGVSEYYCITDTSFPNIDITSATSKEKERFIERCCNMKVNQLKSNLPIDFSILPKDCNLNVSDALLEGMFEKASRILSFDVNGDTGIMRIPSREQNIVAFSTLSSTSKTNHVVSVHQDTGKVTCQCKSYTAHKICSHSIAAAHTANKLFLFVSYHRKHFRGSTSAVLTQTMD